MKRNILYIATICLAVLSLAGCKTDEEPEWGDVGVPPVNNTVNDIIFTSNPNAAGAHI